jgi:hypothetical protein
MRTTGGDRWNPRGTSRHHVTDFAIPVAWYLGEHGPPKPTPRPICSAGFGLRRLTAQQSSDFYQVIIERHRRSSTIVTSNRAIEEWIPLFDDPILAQSALDRLAHNAYQVVIEGESYRSQQRPGRTPPAKKPNPRM